MGLATTTHNSLHKWAAAGPLAEGAEVEQFVLTTPEDGESWKEMNRAPPTDEAEHVERLPRPTTSGGYGKLKPLHAERLPPLEDGAGASTSTANALSGIALGLSAIDILRRAIWPPAGQKRGGSGFVLAIRRMVVKPW